MHVMASGREISSEPGVQLLGSDLMSAHDRKHIAIYGVSQ